MYKEDELYPTPPDNNKIWRYLDFAKFMSLLDTSALFFSRLDKLGDPFEGSLPIGVLEVLRNEPNVIISEEYLKKRRTEYSIYINKITAVNCWHLNRYESAAMWKVYLKNDEGIAIQSTIERLKHCFKDTEHDISITNVRYIDYDKLPPFEKPWGIIAFPAIHKRKLFRDDHELRAVIRKEPKRSTGSRIKPTINNGIIVPVDLNILIDKIYLAPTSPIWQLDLLKSILVKHQLSKKVIQSSLNDKPFSNIL